MAVKSYGEYLEELKKAYAPQEAQALSANEQKYATEKQLAADTYNRQIDETSKSYEDLYDENAVNRLINEREIAENMANLGLTDSGLNRTQQTAVQLSYANSKNRIDTARQKAVDTLTASLADAITKLDIEQNDNAASIKSNYAALASSGAQEMYNNAVQEETKRIELEQKANYLIKANDAYLSPYFTGTLREHGVSVRYYTDKDKNKKTKYIDENSGKVTTVDYHTNPYTGTENPDTKYGWFSNGYQPDNIGNNKLKWDGDTAENVYGNEQKVFYLKNEDGSKTYYVWDRFQNGYTRAYYNSENREWEAELMGKF